MRFNQHLSGVLALLAGPCALLVMGGRLVSAAPITIQTVQVGNLGNAADTNGDGAVNYSYSIGEYDVTVSQYTAFLNAVAATDTYQLYVSAMSNTSSGDPGIVQSGSSGSYTYSVAGGRGNHPVTDVSFWSACRFANWLSNGQPSGGEGAGTTETGTYTLTSGGITGNTVTRNAGATWAVTSENEWYKAAYYSPTLNSGAGGYWTYATQSSTISTSQANYNGNGINDSTAVGTYAYPSYYGTYDQAGNVNNWTESIIVSGMYRQYRGGSFGTSSTSLQSSSALGYYPTDAVDNIGFRVSDVPEPASLAVFAVGAVGMLLRRRGG